MNEEFYNSIPPQIRRNPQLLAGYLLNMQMQGNTTDSVYNTPVLNDIPQQNVGNTITLTDSQLADDASTATNPEVFTDPETNQRMAQNRKSAENQTQTGNFQFFNPYMGVDIPTASYMFGQSLGEGNTGMAIATGLKTGLGLGRNILSGLGYAKQRQKLMDEYYDNQRKTVTQENNPTYYEDGGQQVPQQGQEEQMQQILEGVAGALSQGVNPSDILQELIRMGIPETEARQMIEFVMQQMSNQQQVQTQQVSQDIPPQEQPTMRDGGQYLSKLKGKTISNYTYNPTTGNYEVEFE